MNIAEGVLEPVAGGENLRIAVVMDVAVLKFVLRQLALSYSALATMRLVLTEEAEIEKLDVQMKVVRALIERAVLGIEEARRPTSGEVN